MAVDDLYKRACEAIERANYDYAIRLLRDVLRQDPEHPNARSALRGTERRRAEEGSTLARLIGWPLRALVTLVKSKLARGRKKLELFEDYLEKNPNSFWGLVHVARTCRAMGFQEEALNSYRDALRQKPQDKAALREIGDLLKARGEHAEALKYLQRLLDLQPADRDLDKEVRDLTATQHMSVHDMEGAESFRDLIRDRDEADRLEQEGRIAMTVEDVRGQIPAAEHALAEHPDNVNRILTLARLYVEGDQLPKAQKLLRERHQANPQNYELREALGEVQLRIYDRAIQQTEQAAKAGDQDAAAKAEELKARRQHFAVKEHTWRLEQHPTDRELHLKLGRVHYSAGDYNEAIAAFQNAAQDSRFALESRNMLGLCFMAKGQHDLAIEQFEYAIKVHPEMDEMGKEVRYNKALACEAMGKADEALAIYKRLYSEDINFRDVAAKVDALSG